MPSTKALKKQAFLIAWCALLLAGCASSARETFDLSGAPLAVEKRITPPRSRIRLAVNEPDAFPPINSDRIVIRTGPNEVANLAGAQWADRLTRLVQARLIEGFDDSGIAAAPPGMSADVMLATEIRRFEIDVAQQSAVVEIAARMIDANNGRQRAARVFVSEAPAAHTTGSDATRALREAMETTIRQIAKWSAGHI
jgi:cholesterol transport system auxiliary component